MTNTENTGSTRARVSKRDFIDANGKVVDRIEDASGARYSLMDGAAVLKAFDVACGEPGKPETMLAIFGAHTKLGNVANTCLNDKDSPGTVADAADEIGEWLAGLQDGTWRERSEGAAFKRIDKETIALILGEKDAAGKNRGPDFFLSRLQNEKGFFQKVWAVPAVKDEYYTRRNETPPTKKPRTLDDVLA